jgi:hypothetical protein
MNFDSLFSFLPFRQSGVDALKDALAEPRERVEIYGVFEEPRLDPQGAETALFPVTVYDAETNEPYDSTKVEFEIAGVQGRQRMDDFLEEYGVEDRMDLDEMEDKAADVTRDYRGNIIVKW